MIETGSSSSPMECKCLVIKDEREFCSYIESHLSQEGLELVETSPIARWSPFLSAEAF